jgi:hypothetical protein
MPMVKWSGFYLSFLLAIIFTGIGAFYLVPGVYHPFSSDTVNQTYPHLKYAAAFLALALLAVIAGRFSRPAGKP